MPEILKCERLKKRWPDQLKKELGQAGLQLNP
jgi:hypothetical protein